MIRSYTQGFKGFFASFVTRSIKQCLQVLATRAALILLPGAAAFAQPGVQMPKGSFQLQGTLRGRDTGYIVLWYPDTSGKYIRDTAQVQGGRFLFRGYVTEPSFAHLLGSDREGNYASFFLEGGKQVIALEENKFAEVRMTGSVTQKENEELQRLRSGLEQKREALRLLSPPLSKTLNTTPDSSVKGEAAQRLDSLNSEIAALTSQLIDVSAGFIRRHPGSYVGPTELLGLISALPLDTVIRLYRTFPTAVRGGRVGQLLQSEIQKRKKLTAGNSLSNFTATDVHGQRFTFNTFKGRYVLLDFWASWCVPCRKAIPEIRQVYATYHPKGFDVVAISLDRNPSAWKEAIEKESISSWTHLLLSADLEQFQGVHEIPQTLLLDASGKIIWSSFDVNKESWQEVLQKALEKN